MTNTTMTNPTMTGPTPSEANPNEANANEAAGRRAVPQDAAASRLQIDKSLPTPAYLQLKEQLAHLIADGELRAGTALPSERDLAEALGLSRMTVRRAFEALGAEQLVEQRQGSGTYVRPRPLVQTIDRVMGFTDEARHLGFRPGGRLLDVRRRPADAAVAEALQLPADSRVLRITRLRTADGTPLAVQIAYLRPELAELGLERLERNHSLYHTIREQFGIIPHRARQTVSARLPDPSERKLLEIGRSEPVLAIERITYDAAGTPFEYVRSAYRGDRYQMALDLRAPDA